MISSIGCSLSAASHNYLVRKLQISSVRRCQSDRRPQCSALDCCRLKSFAVRREHPAGALHADSHNGPREQVEETGNVRHPGTSPPSALSVSECLVRNFNSPGGGESQEGSEGESEGEQMKWNFYKIWLRNRNESTESTPPVNAANLCHIYIKPTC